MKWLVFLIILGVSEVAVIGQLHAILELYTLIVLYVITTALGAIFLGLQYPEFKRSMKASKSLGKKFKKQYTGPECSLSPEQIEKMRPFLFVGCYGIAFTLIVIPGIISDILGIIMVIPIVISFFINRSIDKVIAKAELQP